jgi:microsomal dipeptidase-like Zn-dependent dipeptidase
MKIRHRLMPYATIGAVALAVLWLGLALELEGFVNRVEPVPLGPISPRARAVHDTAFVADLHADSLLFGRDLLESGRHGHVDLPRLQEGGVGLQVFAVPTVVPLGANIERTELGPVDMITVAGIVQLSPMAWMGPTARAVYRARQLKNFVRASNGALLWVDDRGDLIQLLDARAAGADVTGALLAIEGGHAMGSDPAHLETLFEAGYRMIGLAHFFDNDYTGSAHGVNRGGLTDLGRRMIHEMEEKGIVIDLAHLSPTAIDETLDLATRPTVFSHGGVRGTCDNRRNLSDAHIRRIAEGGGLIGIGYWELAVCGTTPADIARAIVYVVELVGPDYAALGSDYDGGTTVGFDATGLPAITQALFDAGLDEGTVRKVLGENVLRVLSETLPPAGGLPAAS